jgi:hypothetical protein
LKDSNGKLLFHPSKRVIFDDSDPLQSVNSLPISQVSKVLCKWISKVIEYQKQSFHLRSKMAILEEKEEEMKPVVQEYKISENDV